MTKIGYSGKDRILVGDKVFSVIQSGQTEVMGKHTMTENGRVVVDTMVQIHFSAQALSTAKANPASFAAELQLVNAREFACDERANALLLLGDDLNHPYPLMGNCLVLK